MNIFFLAISYLRSKPLNAILNLLLLSLGIGVITILLLLRNQLEEKITDNVKGIDLVVGAKGSPMQIILCNIFHIDFPTGNINLREADKIAANRLVKQAIPLALGDSYSGFRIIGTNHAYVQLYDAVLSEGEWWKNPMEVTIGSNVASVLKLRPGDSFTSTHGLTSDGHGHEEKFIVKGILRKGNTVLDNLILTRIESVWHVHDIELKEVTRDSLTSFSKLVPGVPKQDTLKEITSMLIEYRSPMGAIQLPRLVNQQSGLQAASPAFETARLFSILGVGVEVISGFASVLIFISALSIFIALYNSLRERKYDLAIMRTMGATRFTVMVTILLEGTLLTFLGSIVGIIIGHSAIESLSLIFEESKNTSLSGLIFYREEYLILSGSLLLGLICAAIPAIQAYRTDISKVLAGN